MNNNMPRNYTGPAIWANQSGDMPINVIGYMGIKDNRHYFSIEGSTAGIPGDEIRLMVDPIINTHLYLRNLIEGNSPNGIRPVDCGKWEDVIEEVEKAYQEGGIDPVLRIIINFPDLVHLASADPEIMESEQVINPTFTPLTDTLNLSTNEDPTSWLNTYVDYASKVSPMTPALFHESAALWLVSVAIARRIKLPMAFGDVYPNLFIVWIAITSLFKKTTALDIARKLAQRCLAEMLGPTAISPEALKADMAGEQPANYNNLSQALQNLWKQKRDFAAQKGWIVDELSSVLTMARKDYGKGTIEALMKFYDCDPRYEHSTRTYGLTIIENSYLSLIGATTPIAISNSLANDEFWLNGFWPRFAILTPETDRPTWQEAIKIDEPIELAQGLIELINRPELDKPTWPLAPKPIDANIDQEAHDLWSTYNKLMQYDLITPDLDHRLHGTYARLSIQALKIAIILAALDWKNNPAPRIKLEHMSQAIAICEKWRASAHRALKVVADSDYNRISQRVVRILSNPNIIKMGQSFRNICKGMKDIEPDRVENALIQLEKAGVVKKILGGTGPKGGRPTDIYILD